MARNACAQRGGVWLGSHAAGYLGTGTLRYFKKHESVIAAEALGAAHRAEQEYWEHILFCNRPGTGTKPVKTATIIATKLLGKHG
jgi:hypothetical protein